VIVTTARSDGSTLPEMSVRIEKDRKTVPKDIRPRIAWVTH